MRTPGAPSSPANESDESDNGMFAYKKTKNKPAPNPEKQKRKEAEKSRHEKSVENTDFDLTDSLFVPEGFQMAFPTQKAKPKSSVRGRGGRGGRGRGNRK